MPPEGYVREVAYRYAATMRQRAESYGTVRRDTARHGTVQHNRYGIVCHTALYVIWGPRGASLSGMYESLKVKRNFTSPVQMRSNQQQISRACVRACVRVCVCACVRLLCM